MLWGISGTSLAIVCPPDPCWANDRRYQLQSGKVMQACRNLTSLRRIVLQGSGALVLTVDAHTTVPKNRPGKAIPGPTVPRLFWAIAWTRPGICWAEVGGDQKGNSSFSAGGVEAFGAFLKVTFSRGKSTVLPDSNSATVNSSSDSASLGYSALRETKSACLDAEGREI